MFSRFSNPADVPSPPNPQTLETLANDLDTLAASLETPTPGRTSDVPETSGDDTELSFLPSPVPAPPAAHTVEKISQILSPYFIVLVGLFLYDDNFLIGTALILTGIFSLLKISWQDVQTLIQKVTAFFQTKA